MFWNKVTGYISFIHWKEKFRKLLAIFASLISEIFFIKFVKVNPMSYNADTRSYI